MTIFDQINTLKAQRQSLFASANAETDPTKLTAIRDQIQATNDQISAAEEISRQMAGNAKPVVTGDEPAQDQGLTAMRKSNEYARAFAYAVANGITLKQGRADEKCKVLYDALTIAGGSPAGEDGGFLVPEDVDRMIREFRREFRPLSQYFNVENVSTNSGWRVHDTAPTTGLTALGSEIPAGGIAKDDQPAFAKVTYELATYGVILPVSNELAADEVSGLMAYLSRWFARKSVILENSLLLAKLATLAASNIAPTDDLDAVAQIKQVLNKSLDPAISASAAILTNQDGYNYLDLLTDANGRPLLQPNVTDPTQQSLKGRPVIVLPNSILASTNVNAGGATDGDYYPIYVGSFKDFATLFMRQPLEIRSTDVGGSAWNTNSIEIRGITRMGVSIFDSAAAVRRAIYIAE